MSELNSDPGRTGCPGYREYGQPPTTSQSGDESNGEVRIVPPRLCYTDGEGRTCAIPLLKPRSPVVIGRAENAHVPLTWDDTVSSYHAVIEWMGAQWTLVDQDSRNGTLVNGVRLSYRRRLVSGDRIRIGSTTLTVEALPPEPAGPTSSDSHAPPWRPLTASERTVLISLCRPFKHNPRFATPPTNGEIAAELNITDETVTKHIQKIYGKFEIERRFEVENATTNQKRTWLVECAMQSGEITDGDL